MSKGDEVAAATAKMAEAFGRAAADFNGKILKAFGIPAASIGKPDVHTSSCQELRRAGIVRTCTCPKGF